MVQPQKKGRNLKKKEETAPQKKATKTRGKGGNRNAALNEDDDAALNEEDSDTVKAVKDSQKKTNKENVSITAAKRGRGKKGAGTTIANNENGEKVSENSPAEENALISPEILTSNNNVQKSLEDDDDKEQDAEVEQNKINETITIKNEVNQDDLSTTVHEKEN